MQFLVDSVLNYATVTASEADGQHPAVNVAIRRLTDTWRSLSVGTLNIDIALEELKQINRIAIVGHNITVNDGLKLISSASPDYSSPSEVIITDRQPIIFQEIEPDQELYYRIQIEKVDNVFCEIAYIHLGVADIDIEHVWGGIPGFSDNHSEGISPTMQVFIQPGSTIRAEQIRINCNEECYDDVYDFMLIDDIKNQPGVLIKTPEDRTTKRNIPFFARMTGAEFGGVDICGYYNFSLDYVESK